jgi:hypothetical protein
MKQLLAVFLSTAAICAFVSATRVVAQETIAGAPRLPAPNTRSHGPGNGYDYDPFGAVGAILAELFDATTSNPAATTPPKARCRVIRDFNDSQARPTAVCGP